MKSTIGKRNKRIHLSGRFVRILIIVIAAGIIAVFGMNQYVRYEGGKNLVSMDELNYTKDDPADCAMILGASIYADRTPTPMLKDRLDRGIELYKKGVVKKLLMSGDNGQVNYNEVEAMKEYALKHGVKAKDIFLDHAGFSTYESVYRAKAVFNVKKMIIVTQIYHEYRALYIAKRLNLNAVGVAAEDINYSGDTMRECREILARDKDFLKCIVKPKPTYLGDVIKISGDGHASW